MIGMHLVVCGPRGGGIAETMWRGRELFRLIVGPPGPERERAIKQINRRFSFNYRTGFGDAITYYHILKRISRPSVAGKV